MSASRNARETSAATPQVALPPLVNCDICELCFALPAEIAEQGVISGLLVCSQCIEDSLSSRQLEDQP